MKRRKFYQHKLWRDKAPDNMRRQDAVIHVTILDDLEYNNQLGKKLIEEAYEVHASKTDDELLSELADVLEVFMALCDVQHISFQSVEEKRKLKKIEHGGFDQRIYNSYVEIREDNPNIQYYIKRPLQYPQILKDL